MNKRVKISNEINESNQVDIKLSLENDSKTFEVNDMKISDVNDNKESNQSDTKTSNENDTIKSEVKDTKTSEKSDIKESNENDTKPSEIKDKKTSLKRGIKQSNSDDRKPSNETDTKGTKLPKRKVALLMGYCGTGYQGMQVNPAAKTIEGELWNALIKSGSISSDNSNDMKKVSFMRAARTDKGVHAAGQCVSLKLILTNPNLIQEINAYLPNQIRIFDIIRTTNSFHSKNHCDSRIYEYLLPTYALRDADPTFFPRSKLAQENGMDVTKAYTDLSLLTEEEIQSRYSPTSLSEITSDRISLDKSFRVTKEKLEKLQSILLQYKGTFNFHNFTNGKKPTDKSAMRYILNFTVGEPFIKHDTEWVSCKVHGQSFMLHQIRKMIGFAVLLVQTHSPIELVKESFSHERMNIPKAPAFGLLLEQTVFSSYNEKHNLLSENDENNDLEISNENNPSETLNAFKTTNKEIRKPVSFKHLTKPLELFKNEWIYSKMIQQEIQEFEFENWICGVEAHSKEFEWYLTFNGKIDFSQKPPHVHQIINGKEGDKEDDLEE